MKRILCVPRTIWKWICLIGITLALSLSLLAQVAPTGTVSGVVKDSLGLVVPNARVTIVNADSNYTRTATTKDDGGYSFVALPVGRYNVRVETAGFKTETESGIVLDVSQEAVVNFGLQIGTIQDQVVVQADEARVDTTTSSLGHVVDNQQIVELPLNGRNFIDLTLLQTGITQFQNNNFGTNGLFGEFYSSNGAPIRSNEYTLDGAIMGNIQGASASSIAGLTLGLDAISEYKVETNTFGAEYGLVMGSQTTIVTKSGTNRFHGDIFEYLRNSVLDARNYFDDLYSLPTTVPGGGRRVAPFERNQFGGALGGPIVKDKTFFFATYEGFREVLDNPPNIGVTPTIPAQCHTPVAGGVQTVDYTCDSNLKAGQTEQVTPSIVPILALWPNPDLPGNQFTYESTERTHEDYAQGRIDHTFTARDTMFGRYTFDNTNEVYPRIFPIFDNGLQERQQYLTLSENHIFSPVLLNSARVSYSRSAVVDATPSKSNPYTSSVTGPGTSCITGLPICPFNISSIANFSDTSAAAIQDVQDIGSFGDDVFLNKGKNAFRFGALINHFDQYANGGAGPKGTVAFSNLHSFLTGNYRSYTTYAPGYNSLKDVLFDTIGFYGTDEYHLTTRLTLNLGLRYEFSTQPEEKNGRQSYFVNAPYSDAPTSGPLLGNPTHRDVSPRVGFAWDIFGNGKTSLKGGGAILYDVANNGGVYQLTGLGLPPNVVAYTVTPSTPGAPSTLVLPLPLPPGVSGLQGTAPTDINYNYKSPHMIDYNMAIERELPGSILLNVAYAGSRGLNLWQPVSEMNPDCPTSYAFVPQGCPTGPTAAFPNFPGTTVIPGSLPVWGAKLANAPRLNTFFSNFSQFNSWGVSWYNALQVNVTKKLTHGVQFQAAYTYSKLLDDTEGLSNSDSSGATTGQVEDPLNPILDYGPGNYDIRHNLHFNALYHLPNISQGHIASKFVNGWWTGSIVTIQTGQPFSPLLSSDREQAGLAGTNGGLERPSYVTAANIATVTAQAVAAGVTTCPAGSSGCIPYNPVIYNPKTVITHSVNQWFNPNMFTLPPVGTIGNVSRNTLREPGLDTWDFSLNKDTAWALLGDQGMVQFRAEVFNLLNHPNFGPALNGGFLAGSVGDVQEQPSFTGIVSTNTPSREIQFALKVLF
jgi:hypothetical protein